VTLSYISDVVALDVRDDGVGVTADAANGGFGLRGLRERAQQFGATVDIDSAPGEGTMVSVTIPAFRTETYPVVTAVSLGTAATGRAGEHA
jgi:signal transduction histidine kinase